MNRKLHNSANFQATKMFQYILEMAHQAECNHVKIWSGMLENLAQSYPLTVHNVFNKFVGNFDQIPFMNSCGCIKDW